MASFTLRGGVPEDLAWIRALLDRVPEAGPWTPEDYSFLVAEPQAGFICWSEVSPGDEFEILNLAVAPEQRRRGVARALLEAAGIAEGTWFLEVRESNSGARSLYAKAGFQEMGRRKKYYQFPTEDAVVLIRKRW